MTRTRTTAGPRASCKRARRCSQTTVALAHDASPAEAKVAIAELSNVGQGNVTVSGLGSAAQPFVVTLTGALAATSVTLTNG